MRKKLFLLLIFVSFLKQLVWSSFVPLWHFPDEQAHFGQVAYIAEKGENPYGDANNLTQEIYVSEKLLGTVRDSQGVNKFTYHPEYRIDYSNSLVGLYEKQISDLSKIPQAREMVIKEASGYSSFYYAVLGFIYRLFYSESIFVRVFLVRIIQSFYLLGTIITAYFIGRELFRDDYKSITLATLVSFQPMSSFVGAGVNSDNFGNLIFSVFILLSLRVLRSKGLNKKVLIQLLITSFLAVYSKPQFIVVVPLSAVTLIFVLIKSDMTMLMKLVSAVISLIVLALIVVFSSILKIGPLVPILRFISIYDFSKLIDFVKTYALPHIYREVLPWYWGIFDWLGVTYPRLVHRSINWILLISIIGFMIRGAQRLKKITKWPYIGVLYLCLAILFLVSAIYSYDWIEFSQTNIHLGIQGRYFFPVLIPTLVVVYLGASRWLSINIVGRILSILMIILNTYALYIISKTYYSFNSLEVFISQISQYKPWFFKGIGIVSLSVIYLMLLAYYIKVLVWPSDEK